MEPLLAARHPFEMLHHIGDIGASAVDPGGVEAAVEQLPGGADEGPALKVLLIAGGLTDEHQRGVRGAFAEDRLGGVGIERAGGAAGRGFPQARDRRLRRDEIGGGRRLASQAAVSLRQ